MSTPTVEDLLRMRDVTRMTGVLNNVQMQQLKMWPLVILGAGDGAVEFDPEACILAVEVSNLDYKGMMQGQTNPVEMYNNRMAKFNDAVKLLLGDEYAVVVKMKGKVLGSFPPKSMALQAHMPEKKK